jgi:signal transduction histidine kinase
MTALLKDTPLTPEPREYLGLASSSAESLLSVLNEILDFSKVESGKLQLESVEYSPEECLQQALELLAAVPQNKPIDLTSELAPNVPAMVCGTRRTPRRLPMRPGRARRLGRALRLDLLGPRSTTNGAGKKFSGRSAFEARRRRPG